MCRTKTLILGVLLLGIGAAAGILLDRYTLQTSSAEPKPIRPDQEKLIASWDTRLRGRGRRPTLVVRQV